MNWKACIAEKTTCNSESSWFLQQFLGIHMWNCSCSEGFHFFGETERENVSFICEVVSSYLAPPLSAVQKYPGQETRGDFRGKKGLGDEALITVCLSLSLLSYQGQTQRAIVGPLDSWKVLPIKHLTKPHLLRCVQC